MNTDTTNHFRVDNLTPQEDAERLARIRAKTASPHQPEDSRVDYEDPAFRAIAPQGWSRHHG